ncbi:hypothetical protein [Bacillus cereus]
MAKAGDHLLGDVTGVVNYNYGNYRISPSGDLTVLQGGEFKQDVTNILLFNNNLTIATYNIEKFSANNNHTSDDKIKRLTHAIKYNLKQSDIIGIQEMQDNNGTLNGGTIDASLSAKRLIDAIREIDGPQYEYADIVSTDNKDSGVPWQILVLAFFIINHL